MARLGIYPQCKAGDHARTIVERVDYGPDPRPGWRHVQKYTDGRPPNYYGYRTVGHDGCSRLACTCACHQMHTTWLDGRMCEGSCHNDLSRAMDVVEREIRGFLEDQGDDEPGVQP